MLRWALTAMLALSGLGLGCGPRDRGIDLKEAVRTYNQRLRWNAFEQASTFIAAEKRAEWLASRSSGAAGLHITDIQIVRLQKPDPDEQTVEVLVALSWYRMPDTTVQRAVWAQVWQEHEARWRIVDERQVEDPSAVAPPPQWP